MKKKIINSLKFSSLLGFASNNIKGDYTLRLQFDIAINGKGTDAIFNLKGDNNSILNDPTKCIDGNFEDILNSQRADHDVSNFEDIKKKYVPVYYYVNGDKNPKICSVYSDTSGKKQKIVFDVNEEEKVNEVVWVKKSDKKNIVTFCSDVNIVNDIKSTKFLVDKKYIYNLFLKMYPINYKSIDDVKKKYNINITLGEDGNQNIEIIEKIILKIPDTVEFQILDKDVKNNDFITPFNNLENLYIKTDSIGNVFYSSGEIIKEAKLYIFEYKTKKYYIISDKKLKEYELFGFLKTKNKLKDKDLIFDPNSEKKVEGETGNLVPAEYKLIDKVMPKPIVYKYKFTGDSTAFKFNPEEEVKFDSKIKPFSMVNSDEKSNFEENGKTYNTDKYNFIAINKDTNQRFVNNQELEPGTYELKREEKPKKDNDKNKDQQKGQDSGQGGNQGNQSKKICGCC